MNRVADDDDRSGRRPIRPERAEACSEGVVHGVLTSASDVVGDDIEEGIEVVRGRDHRIVERVSGLPGLDQKTAHAGGGIVASVTQAVLDRMTETGAERNGRFQISEDDRALREPVRLQPGPRHVSRGFGARRDDRDVLGAH